LFKLCWCTHAQKKENKQDSSPAFLPAHPFPWVALKRAAGLVCLAHLLCCVLPGIVHVLGCAVLGGWPGLPNCPTCTTSCLPAPSKPPACPPQASVRAEFSGLEPCLICFSVVATGGGGALPRLQCRTCHVRFHPACL